ncbi:MAG TPA: ExbD/TolR family protein [Methylophilaceae bacterium]|jgi:biopolymer transport protein TolR|nr:ExbD/TolR family protein [Methylophilaceae bacterium]
MARTRKRRMMNQINVVPYIDVTLVLLVIFMVTAPMTNPGVVDLPSVGQTLRQTAAPLVVTVRKNGEAEIEANTFPRDQLLAEVKQQLKETPRAVVVAADTKTEYGKVVAIMDLLKQAQVEKVGLLFTPAP